MVTPRPIFVPLLSPETPSPSVFPVDEGNGDGSDNVDTGLVDVVDAVDEVSVVEAGADVIGVEVAPMGVNKELVTTAVLRVAGDPTRSAYRGKKSLISDPTPQESDSREPEEAPKETTTPHPSAPSVEQNATRTLVIAKLQEEDTLWVDSLVHDDAHLTSAVYVVDNNTSAPFTVPLNKGHEVMVYLTYIIDHYYELSDVSIFMHAHQITWHNNDFLDSDSAKMVRRYSPVAQSHQFFHNHAAHSSLSAQIKSGKSLRNATLNSAIGFSQPNSMTDCLGESGNISGIGYLQGSRSSAQLRRPVIAKGMGFASILKSISYTFRFEAKPASWKESAIRVVHLQVALYFDAMSSLDELLKIANPVRAHALKTFDVTAHPDEVLQIPSREEGRFIRIHAYNTPHRDTPTPVLVNFHGSGFVNPLHGSDDEFCKFIVEKTGFVVLDCAYRLAPEHKFPAAVHDAEDAVRWVLSHPEKFDASHLSISGFSAGGILSLVLSSVIFPRGTFKNVFAAYPPTDMVQSSADKTAPDTSIDSAPVELLDTFIRCYYSNPEDVKSVLASPSVIPAEKFSDRIFLVTAACDRLCLEAEALGNRIKDTTAKHIKMHRYEGCGHAFDKAYEAGSVQERAKNDLYQKAAVFLTE
ncbi:hypothetical protein APSETT444_003262 [Aspergillus pseudonomiae]